MDNSVIWNLEGNSKIPKLTDLDYECLEEVFSYLSAEDLSRLSSTNKHFRDTIAFSHRTWKKKCWEIYSFGLLLFQSRTSKDFDTINIPDYPKGTTYHSYYRMLTNHYLRQRIKYFSSFRCDETNNFINQLQLTNISKYVFHGKLGICVIFLQEWAEFLNRNVKGFCDWGTNLRYRVDKLKLYEDCNTIYKEGTKMIRENSLFWKFDDKTWRKFANLLLVDYLSSYLKDLFLKHSLPMKTISRIIYSISREIRDNHLEQYTSSNSVEIGYAYASLYAILEKAHDVFEKKLAEHHIFDLNLESREYIITFIKDRFKHAEKRRPTYLYNQDLTLFYIKNVYHQISLKALSYIKDCLQIDRRNIQEGSQYRHSPCFIMGNLSSPCTSLKIIEGDIITCAKMHLLHKSMSPEDYETCDNMRRILIWKDGDRMYVLHKDMFQLKINFLDKFID